MEIPAQGVMFLQSLSSAQSVGLNAAQRDDSEPDTQPASKQGTPEPRSGAQLQALIEFRIKQLLNRRFLLLRMQSFRNKAEENRGRTTEETTGEDSDDLSELDIIQMELEELQVKKEELEKQEKSSRLSQQDVRPSFYKTEIPRGGIYLLPGPQLTQEDTELEQRVKTRPAAEEPAGPVVQADSLGRTPAATQCPSCQEVVFTETRSRVGESTWMLCCLCSMTGCVAGCCLIPFFMDRLRDVHHQCPQCQTHIHTYQPF